MNSLLRRLQAHDLLTPALGILTFLWVFAFLSHFSDPPGVNGYFYLKQILTLSRDHSYYFKDYSAAFLVPAFFNLFLHNELLAHRLAVALMMSGFVFALGLLAKDLWREHRLAPAVAFFALAFNMAFFELGFGFLKNITALTAVAFAIWFARRATLSGRRSEWGLAILISVLALICHKSAFFIILLIAVSFTLQSRHWKRLAGLVVFAVGLLAVFALIFSQGRSYLAFLLGGLGYYGPGLYFWSKALLREENLIYLSLSWALIYIPAYFYIRSTLNKGDRLIGDFLILMSVMTWLPIYPPGQDQTGYRLMLMYASIMPALAAPILLRGKTVGTFCIGLLFGIYIAQFALSRKLSTMVYNYSQNSASVAKLHDFVTPNDHLICHHGLEFYVDYVTGIRCQIFLSEDGNQKSYRLVYAPSVVPWVRVRALAEPLALMSMGSDYYLLKEEDWQSLAQSEHITNHWRNPSDHRPDYIYAP